MDSVTSKMQTKLLNLGYDVGTIDGVGGPVTGKCLADAIGSGKIRLDDVDLIALKSICRNTPNRKTICSLYGTPNYIEGKKPGSIQILNVTEWRKNLCEIEFEPLIGGKRFKLTINRKVALSVLGAFAEISIKNNAMLPDQRWCPKVIQSYCARHNRWDAREPLSVHTWAAAIDIDPSTNGIGAKTDIPDWAIRVLKDWGAVWGGDWTRYPDPMHFQWMR